MNEPAEYRYDVFVSYRHKDLDRGWAKWLVESLETFKVPAGLIEKGAKAGIDRVFRDEDELPTSANLGENIQQALLASRYLIVICSKDTPESKWVNEEVKTFRQWGRHDRILALLVDGEPSESFPQALGEIRETTTHDDGTTTETVTEVEPLAADVRPRADEAPKLQKQKALLRIVATLVGVNYDDLWQRHGRRLKRQRRIRMAAIAIAVLMVAGGVYEYVRAIKAEQLRTQRQRDVAETQQRRAEFRGLTAQSQLADTYNEPGAAVAYLRGAEIYRDESSTEHNRANRLAKYQYWGGGGLEGLCKDVMGCLPSAFSADGTLLATGTYTGEAQLFDANTGVLKQTLAGHQEAILDLLFLPDGASIITYGRDPFALIHTIGGTKPPKKLLGHKDAINSMTLSPNKKYAVSVSNDGKAVIWNLAGDEPAKNSGVIAPMLTSASWSADGEAIVFVVHELNEYDQPVGRELIVWQWRVDKLTRLPGHRYHLIAAAFLDGDHVLAVSSDGRLKKWRWRTEALLLSEKITTQITSAAIHPKSGRVFAAGKGGELFAIRTSDLKVVASTRDTFGGIRLIAVDALGQYVATSNERKHGRIWRASDLMPLQDLTGHKSVVERLVFSEAGDTLATADWKGRFHLWRLDALKPPKTVHLHRNHIRLMIPSADGKLLATGQVNTGDKPPLDGTIRLLEMPSGKLKFNLRGHHGDVVAFEFYDGQTKAISGGVDGTLRRWDLTTGRQIDMLARYPESLTALAVSADGRYAASAAGDCTSDPKMRAFYANMLLPDEVNVAPIHKCDAGVKRAEAASIHLWDLKANKLIDRIQAHESAVSGLRFHPSGKALISVGTDESAFVYNIEWAPFSLTVDKEWVLDSELVSDLAIDPAGERVAFATAESGSVWSLTQDEPIFSVRGHSAPLASIEFSPDGKRLLTGSADESIRIWDAQNGAPLRVLESDDHRPVYARFSPDGRFVLSSSCWSIVGFGIANDQFTESQRAGTQTAVLWNAQTGRPLLSYPSFGSTTNRAVFVNEAKTVAVGESSGQINLWQMPSDLNDATLAETGKLTNYRLCQTTKKSVPVIPFPSPKTVWAPEELCKKDALP